MYITFPSSKYSRMLPSAAQWIFTNHELTVSSDHHLFSALTFWRSNPRPMALFFAIEYRGSIGAVSKKYVHTARLSRTFKIFPNYCMPTSTNGRKRVLMQTLTAKHVVVLVDDRKHHVLIPSVIGADNGHSVAPFVWNHGKLCCNIVVWL